MLFYHYTGGYNNGKPRNNGNERHMFSTSLESMLEMDDIQANAFVRQLEQLLDDIASIQKMENLATSDVKSIMYNRLLDSNSNLSDSPRQKIMSHLTIFGLLPNKNIVTTKIELVKKIESQDALVLEEKIIFSKSLLQLYEKYTEGTLLPPCHFEKIILSSKTKDQLVHEIMLNHPTFSTKKTTFHHLCLIEKLPEECFHYHPPHYISLFPWNKIGGLVDVKKILCKLVEDPENMGENILFYGPPGKNRKMLLSSL